MRIPRNAFGIATATAVVSLALVAPLMAQPAGPPSGPDTGHVTGRVVDQAGHRLPDVIVSLRLEAFFDPVDGHVPPPLVVATTRTDRMGTFSFLDVAPGSYTVLAEREGYERFLHSPFRVTAGRTARIQATLVLGPFRQELEVVVGDRSASSTEPSETFDANFLGVFRLPSDRFQDALPQLPGVVRDTRGRISFNGTRPSQSALLVNGTTATDPVTGEFAFDVPLKAIDTVEVFTIPYSAEFGRVTGAVASVRTRAGGEHWDFDTGNLWPSLRFRDGGIRGINTATPRVQVGGPLKAGRAWLSQGFTYRFIRSRAYDVPPTESDDEEVLEGFDSFTQVDVRVGDRHTATATASYFPVEIDNLGIDSLTAALATPEFSSTGWNVALADRITTSSNTLWESTVAVRGFDVRTRRQGEGGARLTVDGSRGNYHHELDRHSSQVEAALSYLRFIPSRVGGHLLKLGVHAYRTAFDATDRAFPIELLDATGRVRQRIDFDEGGRLDATDLAFAGFVQDQWHPTNRLALDLGLRYDYERLTSSHQLAPRVAFAYSLGDEGRTIVKGGWGLFFDQVFLLADQFERLPGRREQRIDSTGRTLDTVVFRNEIASDGLAVPRSTAWNVELDRQLGPAWMLRVNYRERRASQQTIVDRDKDAPGGPRIVLSSTGRSMVREFDATMRRSLPAGAEVFMSFSKRRTTGDLNDLASVYGNLRSPLLLDSENGLQPFDVPNRFLLWGTIELPKDIVLAPAVEWRSGFPYTVFDEEYRIVGARNGGGRFPSFLSADVRVTKAVTLFGKRARVGVEIFNLTNRTNPRDVVDNLGSASFGAFRNGVDISARFRLELSL